MTITALGLPDESGPLATPQQFVDFTEAWLNNRRLSANTRDAYRRDVHSFLAWCADRDLSPLLARFTHINEYGRWLEATPQRRTGKPLAPASVARKLAGLSSWYDFLVKMDLLGANPVAGADRPSVDRDQSTTVGLTSREVDALLRAAQADSPRAYALMCLLADLGLRVSEAVGLKLDDLVYERGHRTVRFTGKGGRVHRRLVSPGVSHAVNTYLLHRADEARCDTSELSGPVFVTKTGKAMDRHLVFKMVRELAKRAGIESADRLSPHSLRHAFATTARQEGASLEDVQDAMGHADPRTTRRYDRNRHSLENDPSYRLWLARQNRGGMAA